MVLQVDKPVPWALLRTKEPRLVAFLADQIARFGLVQHLFALAVNEQPVRRDQHEECQDYDEAPCTQGDSADRFTGLPLGLQKAIPAPSKTEQEEGENLPVQPVFQGISGAKGYQTARLQNEAVKGLDDLAKSPPG